jgi:hypothetical protein
MIGDEHQEEDRLGDGAGDEAPGAAEAIAQMRARHDVDHGRDLRREPHDQRDDEQRHAGIGPDEIRRPWIATASVPSSQQPDPGRAPQEHQHRERDLVAAHGLQPRITR